MKNTVAKADPNDNYGSLTEISRGINQMLGDKSGRTVSRRTTHGFKDMFGLDNMRDQNAEHIVHAGMIGAVGLLSSKNSYAKAGGIFLLGMLFIAYHAGK